MVTDDMIDTIGQASAEDLSRVFIATAERLGELGRPAAELIHTEIGTALHDLDRTTHLEEGIAHIETAIGLDQ